MISNGILSLNSKTVLLYKPKEKEKNLSINLDAYRNRPGEAQATNGAFSHSRKTLHREKSRGTQRSIIHHGSKYLSAFKMRSNITSSF